ncbi:MAG: FAD-dependent oxidoreductase [Planctomycetota bacterium]
MKTWRMPERTIPHCDTYDVIVVGGGPSGCAAAAASAREGSSTLLIEATGALGGMGTLGLVPAWCPFSDKEKIIYRGLAERVFNETKAGMPHVRPDGMDWVPIDPERLKRVYDDLVTEFGADILFNTALSAFEMQDGTVKTIIVTNKAGLSAYSAKVFVDCTGDADLCAWAGADFQKGDPATGDLQPATHCFVITNVDPYHYATGPKFNRSGKNIPYQLVKDEKYPHIVDTHCCNSLIGPGAVGFNSGHIYQVDNTDPVSLSKAHIQGRKMAAQYRDALAEYMPGAFGAGFLAATGTLMGIRETRRIVGDYVLTKDDYVARRSFNDEICRNAYYIDIHLSKDEERLYNEGKLDFNTRALHYSPGESHGVPYRCLTPKGIKNALVAGRSISTDRTVQGSTRVMPVCLAMGEAAGLAASHAIRDAGSDVHAVNVDTLRNRLKEEGAYLP